MLVSYESVKDFFLQVDLLMILRRLFTAHAYGKNSAFILRVVAASVLIVGGISKFFALYHLQQIDVAGWSLPRSIAIPIVFLELSVSMLLLGGVWLRVSLIASIVMFSIFSCLQVYMVASGMSSCGCLGSYEVNPWIMLIADLLVLAMLCFARLIHRRAPSRPRHIFGSACLIISASLCGVLALPGPPPGVDKTTSAVLAETPTVGSRLPIDEIALGEWCVVLYRTTCSHCKDVMDDWIDLSLIDRDVNGRRWIFIDIGDSSQGPSIIDFTKHEIAHVTHKMPLVRTPQVLLTKSGTVLAAFPSPSELMQGLGSGQ